MVTMMVAAIEHKTGFAAVLNDPSDKERAVFSNLLPSGPSAAIGCLEF